MTRTRDPLASGVDRNAPSPATWTVLGLIRWSADYLVQKGVDQGRLDAEHLLAHALETDRLHLYLQYDRPLSADELAVFKALLLRRARREPLQYILGRVAFRELELAVDQRVLVPRPETETLVQVVLDWCGDRTGLEAVDLGTGSGCVALSLVHEGPFRRVVATDVSTDALDLARSNARGISGGDRLEFRLGSLCEPLAGERFDAIVSNPPYVSERDRSTLQPEVRDWEPGAALFAGDGGLDVLEQLVHEAPGHLRPGGLLALEVGLGQAAEVARLLDESPALGGTEIHRDLSRRERVVTARSDAR
jgi:release factor glutamine methyltransferase